MQPDDNDPIFRLPELRRRFDRAAPGFDDADFLHRRAFEGLIDRLAPMQLEPATILDLGAATGTGSRALAKTWRRARVISLDISRGMLAAGRRGRSWFSRIRDVQADAGSLPFNDGSLDMVFANLSLPWLAHPEQAFADIARVLKKEGLFVFATLGPDTLVEVREAWRSAEGGAAAPHVHPFADMHDIGDALVRAGLRDPVLDVERITVTYSDPRSLYRDLHRSGARNALAGRRAGLTGRGRFRHFEDRLCATANGGDIGITVELVFGHAWGSGRRQSAQEFHVDPGTIGRMRRNS